MTFISQQSILNENGEFVYYLMLSLEVKKETIGDESLNFQNRNFHVLSAAGEKKQLKHSARPVIHNFASASKHSIKN